MNDRRMATLPDAHKTSIIGCVLLLAVGIALGTVIVVLM